MRACKILAFAIASAFEGVGGSLYALLAQYVVPDSFTVTLSTWFIVAAMVGGVRSIAGAFLGAMFIVLVPDITNSFSHSLTQLVMAVAILIVIYLRPTGIVGLSATLQRRFRHQTGASPIETVGATDIGGAVPDLGTGL